MSPNVTKVHKKVRTRSLQRDTIEESHAPICTVATSEIKFLPSDAPNASAQANVAVHLGLANKKGFVLLEGSKGKQ